MRPSAEAQSSARDRKWKRVRVRSIGVYSVRTDGRHRERFTTGVPTGHRPRLAGQAALNAATEHGETTVRQELIAHLNCLNRRRARGTQGRGGVRRFTCLVRVFSGGDS